MDNMQRKILGPIRTPITESSTNEIYHAVNRPGTPTISMFGLPDLDTLHDRYRQDYCKVLP